MIFLVTPQYIFSIYPERKAHYRDRWGRRSGLKLGQNLSIFFGWKIKKQF